MRYGRIHDGILIDDADAFVELAFREIARGQHSR